MRIEVDEGVSLSCEDGGGEGPAVLFIHGLGGSANSWLAQTEACRARGWRPISYDMRGAGRSDRPLGPYSVEGWATDAVALLDALGIEEVALVGHSVGCMVAEHAAHRLGDRTTALAVIGGALAWRPEAAPVFSERIELAMAGRMDEIAETVAATGLSQSRRDDDPRLLGLFREAIASNDPVAYAECTRATAPARMLGPAALSCPLLAMCGSEDPVTPPVAAQAIVAETGSGETAVVEGSAHWCAVEDPAQTSDLLLGWLAKTALESHF